MFKIAGGNIGILTGGQIFSKENQGCPRRIFLRNHKIDEPINEASRITFALGRMMESVFAETHPECKMNVRPPEMLPITKTTVLGLETDAMDVDRYMIWELKTVSSTSKLKDYIIKGDYKLDNVMQLALYLLAFNNDDQQIDYGVLKYTNVVYDSLTVDKIKYSAKPGMSREFRCEWKDGVLLIENKPSRITEKGITRFIEYVAHVLEERPPMKEVLKPTDEEGNNIACHWCYWKSQCAYIDDVGGDWDEFKSVCEGKC